MPSFMWPCAAWCVLEVAFAASWAKRTEYAEPCKTPTANGADGPDDEYPMLLDTCALKYRSASNKSVWVYTKAVCNATHIVRTGYRDSACTQKSDDDSHDLADSLACSAERNSLITCGVQHDAFFAKMYMVGQQGDPSKCTDGNYIGVMPFPIGMCFVKELDTILGIKSMCDGHKIVTKTYKDPLTCSGEEKVWFQNGANCSAFFGMHYVALESGCMESEPVNSCMKSAYISMVIVAVCGATFSLHR
eukprot:TRINITY_DN43068_c0_g1_i2.p1 TRINITY_DN43068_c0_g1~~TRINITY_DN43068_c0_g1_i2.p1  ORF type:complete len:247 (-),score=27.20 TRINITY_DN43068_c0_g1_i2:94-834(-)